MKLYHASKHQFAVIKRNQVTVPEGVVVPDAELQNKIYFTPDIGFAIAMAAGPDGITSVSSGYVSFENYSDFDEDRTIYVYEIDSETIPRELVECVDDEQFTVDLDVIEPVKVHEFKAKDVFEYYELKEWKVPNQFKTELNLKNN